VGGVMIIASSVFAEKINSKAEKEALS